MSKVFASLIVVLIMAAGVVGYGVFVLNEENNNTDNNNTNDVETIDTLQARDMKILVYENVVGIIDFNIVQEYGETALRCTKIRHNYTDWQQMTNPPFILQKNDLRNIRLERKKTGVIVSEADLVNMPFIFVFDNGLTFTVNVTDYSYM